MNMRGKDAKRPGNFQGLAKAASVELASLAHVNGGYALFGDDDGGFGGGTDGGGFGGGYDDGGFGGFGGYDDGGWGGFGGYDDGGYDGGWNPFDDGGGFMSDPTSSDPWGGSGDSNHSTPDPWSSGPTTDPWDHGPTIPDPFGGGDPFAGFGSGGNDGVPSPIDVPSDPTVPGPLSLFTDPGGGGTPIIDHGDGGAPFAPPTDGDIPALPSDPPGGHFWDNMRPSDNVIDDRGHYTPVEDGTLFDNHTGTSIPDPNINQDLGGWLDSPDGTTRIWLDGQGMPTTIEHGGNAPGTPWTSPSPLPGTGSELPPIDGIDPGDLQDLSNLSRQLGGNGG